jgi:hypothetical protein
MILKIAFVVLRALDIASVTIPGWAVALLIPAFAVMVGWLVWVTKMTLENKERIAVNTANDASTHEFMKGLKQMVSEIKTEMATRTDKIQDKVDDLFRIIAMAAAKK